MVVQLLLIGLLALQAAVGQDAGGLSINVTSDNNFTISVNGKEWFRSGPVQVRYKGEWLSSIDGSLILGDSDIYPAEDWLGTYNYYGFHYHDRSGQFNFTTFIKAYYKSGLAIIFGHRFDCGTEKAALDSVNDVISSFPSIPVEDSMIERGYLIFVGSSEFNKHVT